VDHGDQIAETPTGTVPATRIFAISKSNGADAACAMREDIEVGKPAPTGR
jgi:hypothetical protein